MKPYRSLAVALLFPAALFAQVTYTFTDLGTLGGNYATAVAINDAGQIVGTAKNGAGQSLAYIYSGGVMTGLATLGGTVGHASGINNAGIVVGDSTLAGNTVTHGFVYQSGTTTDLGAITGNSYAKGVNDNGLIVGYTGVTGGTNAFVYLSGTMTALGSFGSTQSYGYAVNNAGQVAVQTYGPSVYGGVLYDHGTTTALGTLGGSNTFVFGIGEAGQVLGHSNVAGNTNYHAYVFSGGVMTDLGALGGAYNSAAFAINSSGTIVGYSGSPSGNHGFIYSSGQMLDLNTLTSVPTGWVIDNAYDINDSGQIVGTIYNASLSQTRAYVLTAVPEPSTWAALVGFVALLVTTLRRRQIADHTSRAAE